MKIWVITDTHFGHRAIQEYENRPSNCDELIINNWNKYITDDDLVIHLGDFALTGSIEMKKLTCELKGRKVIVRGNHDKSIAWFMSNRFDFACNGFAWRYSNHNILFTHMRRENLETDYTLNVHGHEHTSTTEIEPRRFCLSIERMNYKPILLDDLLGRYQKEIKKGVINE